MVERNVGGEVRSTDAVMLELQRAYGAEDVPSRVASIHSPFLPKSNDFTNLPSLIMIKGPAYLVA